MPRHQPPAEVRLEKAKRQGRREPTARRKRKDASPRTKPGRRSPDFAGDRNCAPLRTRQARPAWRGGLRSRRADPAPRRPTSRADAEYEIPDDLVAAARRAAQAAALKAEERGSGSACGGCRPTPTLRSAPSCRRAASGRSSSSARRFCSPSARCCFIGACGSKPEPEITPPAAEQSAPRLRSRRAKAAPTPGPPRRARPKPGSPRPETPPGNAPAPPSFEPGNPRSARHRQRCRRRGRARQFHRRRQIVLPPAGRRPRRPPQAAAGLLEAHDGPPALPPGVVLSVEEPGARRASSKRRRRSGVRCRRASLCHRPISVRFPCAKPRRKATRAHNTRSRSATPKVRERRKI